MINLSPYDLKKQIKAARANSLLVKYLIILMLASLFIGIICATFYVILEDSRPAPITATPATKTAVPQTADLNGYNQARIQATKINNDLQNAKNILSEQISYSAILTEIANILPSGTIIDKLDLSTNTLNNLSLKIYSKSSSASSEIKQNIEKSSILSNFNLKSVKTETTNPAGYSTTIEITVNANGGTSK